MKFFKVNVKVIVDNNGKQKKTREEYMVEAVSVTDAETKVHEDFKDSGLDFEVASVVETKIIKVIK